MQGSTAEKERSVDEAGRKRAAVELIARHGPTLKRAAGRYSLCADDAEDAYQRTLEILLTKAPTDRARDLLSWTTTVIKREALAIRQSRERLLGKAPRGEEAGEPDRVAQLPAAGAGPAERLERSEEIARSREALRTLKPAELRALTLLAEGYSYAEIAERTGFSGTKVNRCIAEGRERFRRLLSSSEDGSRCVEMQPLLSAFCDGETSPQEATEVHEHLRACGRCRAVMRAYRTAPQRIAALAPAVPLAQTLSERAYEALAGLWSRLPGAGGSPASPAQLAVAGGAKGAGTAALAKTLAICAGAVGGAACVATGVVPSPADLAPQRTAAPRIERLAAPALEALGSGRAAAKRQRAAREARREPAAGRTREPVEPASAPLEAEYAEAAPVAAPEPAPVAAEAFAAPPPSAAAALEPPRPASGGAAGEFGP